MTAARVVEEYGEAFRGDWADVDGRTVKYDMFIIASWLEFAGNYPGDAAARNELGICPKGLGHWTQWCREYDCDTEL